MDQAYLSLGDMLTFIGLIIAVLQLIKPRYLLLWKLSNGFLKSIAICLLIIGYASPLLSILIKSTKPLWDGLLLGQLFQVAGFVAISLGLLIVVFIYSRFNYRHLVTRVTTYRFHFNKYPKKKWRNLHISVERNKIITAHSAKKFYETTSLFLVRGHIEEVVEITRLNLRSLVGAACQYVPERFQLPNAQNQQPLKAKGSNYAFETLYQLLTDKAVMKHISTNNRFFLHAIVECEVNSNNGSINNEFANVLYSNIVEHLTLNASSFLYTQTDSHSGSARFANVYDLLTDDRIIRRVNIVPSLLTWNVLKTDIQLDEYTDVILKLLEPMIDSYKKQPGSTELFRNIQQLFNQLIDDSGISGALAFDKQSKQHYSEDATKSMAFKVFSKLHLAMSTAFFKSDDPDSFKNNDAELKSENKKGEYEQTTLTGLIAQKVYELLEDLYIFYDGTDNRDESMRQEMINYLLPHVNTGVAIRYEELVYERLFDKAVYGDLEIATNIDGYYPYVMRFLINFLAPFTAHLDNAMANAQTKMKDIMANELKEALLADKKMTDDEPMQSALLPSRVEAKVNKSRKTVKYYFVDRKGKKTAIDLSEPKPKNKPSSGQMAKTNDQAS
jgi:hypothetical protein